jgi:mono/diheme cytochrome c family protein
MLNRRSQCVDSSATSPRRRRRTPWLLLSAIVSVLLLTVELSLAAQDTKTGSENTPISGESWLHHLQRPFGETSMGKTWELGPAPDTQNSSRTEWQLSLSKDWMERSRKLNGADLYRINCRGCHGEKGLGAPPEIYSVINPVRATSASLVVKQIKERGVDISFAQAAQMAAQARTAISDRLHKGGENMPAFGYLQAPELRSLTNYLEDLAEVPVRRHSTVQESSLRVGELVARSTCHICHDATGQNPTPEQVLQGAIPPLSTLTTRVNLREFVRKVTHGAPVRMGTPPMLERGRMPVFSYLTEDEAADVYMYLTTYPPQSTSNDRFSLRDSAGSVALNTAKDGFPAATRPLTEAVDGRSLLLILGLGAFATLLIFGGFIISARELIRLSTCQAESRQPTPKDLQPTQTQVCSKSEQETYSCEEINRAS